jgi:hydroxyethylthiazole kinase
MRARAPLVHCLTNEVVQDITANVLLAAGASPAMVVSRQEAKDFAAIADALLINVGTLIPKRAHAMRDAVQSANRAGKPWVLDPVAVGALAYRTQFCRDLLNERPAAIRGNASEILALAGNASLGRGVDSGDTAEHALHVAKTLAQQVGSIVCVTGPTDYITDGNTLWTVPFGSAMMTRVTGVGCALSALVAAFLSLNTIPPMDAAASACAMMALAGQHAASQTQKLNAGIGTFRVQLIDALDLIHSDTIKAWSHE